MSGVFAMSEYAAHGYMNNLDTGTRVANGLGPGGIEYNIHADDPSSDPRLRSVFYPGKSLGTDPGGWLYAASDGIHNSREILMPRDLHNEDRGWIDDVDEIYAYVRFIDGDSGVRRAYSNAFWGRF